MRRIVLSLSIVALLFLTLNSYAQRDDKKKSSDATTSPVLIDGVIYSLPRTGIVFTIKAKREQLTAGPYASFALKYLGINDVPVANKTIWRIISIEGQSFGEPDPNAMFKTRGEAASLIHTTFDGRLSGIGSISMNLQQLSTQDRSCVVNSSTSEVVFTDRSSDYFYDLVVDPSGGEKMTFKSNETKAREAADYLINLRKKRTYHLIDSYDELPTDGKGYDVFVEEAKRLETIYLSLFIGRVIETEHEFKVIYIPEGDQVKNDVAFRFSEERGILPKTDLSGKPVVISMSKEIGASDKLKNSDNPRNGENGLYYRVPATSSLTLTDGSNLLYSQRLVVAQFGTIVPVPEQFLTGKHQVQFDVNTGTITSIAEAK